jgi:transcriptional regulator with XRE-family HTH domain
MRFDLESIGQILRQAREDQGLSLEDVSSVLFLRKSLITAIENGNWTSLPHDVYVKGYVQQYAAMLKVQQEVVPLLAEQKEAEEPVPSEPETVVEDKETSGVPLWASLRRFVGWPAIYASMAALVIVFLVFQNTQKPGTVMPQLGAVAKSVYDSTAKSYPSSEMKKLVIACQERTWVRIVIDDTEKKEFMLNPEEVVMFTAKNDFDLLIGNAGGVTLLMNGQDTGFSGKSGEVKRVKLP